MRDWNWEIMHINGKEISDIPFQMAKRGQYLWR